MNQKVLPLLLPVLVAAVLLLPVQCRLCLAAEAGQKIVLEDTAKEPAGVVTPVQEEKSGLSTPMMIGIGAGVAVLAGVAIAVGSSGGGDDDNGSTATTPVVQEPETPPTSDQFVAAWNATASQSGSGLTYSGYYQLYQGGGLSYNLWVSDGEHFVGGGGWSLSGYTLTMHTDHGSTYVGTVPSGNNITSVTLNSNNGWTLTLSL
jgi:hypothetical protein